MRVARAVARHALVLVFLVLALTPTTAFAFTPPDPNNPGHHYGEYLHNPHLQSTPAATVPGSGGNGGGGIQDSFAGPVNAASTLMLPALQFQPTSLDLPALNAADNIGKDLWWVAVILAAVIAPNVVLGVLWLARAGNFVLRRGLRPVPATA